MLPCFPDYNKIGNEYVAAVIQTFTIYSQSVQTQIASIENGLVSKHSFIPAIAQIREMGDALKAKEDAMTSQKSLVKVFEDTPQWEAWQAERGSTPCVELRDEHENIRRGWYFPTEWPVK